MMEYSLVIPLWNEENNLKELIEMIVKKSLSENGMKELILVNNGSNDRTGNLINEFSNKYTWIKVLHLKENQNYGGGIYEGCKMAMCDIIGYIPGDLQVSASDVDKIWSKFKNNSSDKNKLLVKGWRTERHDGFNTRFVSVIYTFLANLFLGLRIKDLNGLPKFFNSKLLDLIPERRMINFVFDAQLLSLARFNNWEIVEVPVIFHARRSGVSSWSSKRIKTYYETFKMLLSLRKLKNVPGVKIEKLGSTQRSLKS